MATGPAPFELERYFAKYEFHTKYLLSSSDAESMTMRDVLVMADDECRELWDNLSLGYTESAGHPLLISEISELYGNTSADDVLVTIPQEGIYIGMKALWSIANRDNEQAGAHAVATFPGYQSLHENLKTVGCDLSYWTAKLTDSGWTFDMDELRSLLREDTKILVVNFPHNPTGFSPSLAMWKELIQLCKDRNLLLFSDEIYRMTNNDGSIALPAACCLYDNAITLSGLSKAFGLPGARIGWVCTKNKELMNKMVEYKDYLSICSSAPSEILGIIALRNKEALVGRELDIIRHNLDVLDGFFADHKDLFEWHRPKTGTTALVKLKGGLLKLGEDGGARGFCDAVREGAAIMVVPSAMFNFADEYVRLGFGRSNMPEVVEVLKAFLQRSGLKN